MTAQIAYLGPVHPDLDAISIHVLLKNPQTRSQSNDARSKNLQILDLKSTAATTTDHHHRPAITSPQSFMNAKTFSTLRQAERDYPDILAQLRKILSHPGETKAHGLTGRTILLAHLARQFRLRP